MNDSSSGRRSFRSFATNRLLMSPVKLSTVGRTTFLVVGPQIWNDMTGDVTSDESLSIHFVSGSKTQLFRISFPECFLETTVIGYYSGHFKNV